MSKRILVVEDQPDNRQIIRDMLAPTDYEITEAENGEQALAAIAKQRPGLVGDHLSVTNERVEFQRRLTDGEIARLRLKAGEVKRFE